MCRVGSSEADRSTKLSAGLRDHVLPRRSTLARTPVAPLRTHPLDLNQPRIQHNLRALQSFVTGRRSLDAWETFCPADDAYSFFSWRNSWFLPLVADS